MSPITVHGHIVRAAESRLRRKWHGLRDQWVLCFDMRPPAGPSGKPRTYRVAVAYGTGHAASYACSNKARALRRGEAVVVHAQGEDTGRGYSLLYPVDMIDTPHIRPRNVTGERHED